MFSPDKIDSPKDQKKTIQTQLNIREANEKTMLKTPPRKCIVKVATWNCNKFHAKPAKFPIRSNIAFLERAPFNGNIRETNRKSNAVTETMVIMFTRQSKKKRSKYPVNIAPKIVCKKLGFSFKNSIAASDCNVNAP